MFSIEIIFTLNLFDNFNFTPTVRVIAIQIRWEPEDRTTATDKERTNYKTPSSNSHYCGQSMKKWNSGGQQSNKK